jgi:hypothetical protein
MARKNEKFKTASLTFAQQIGRMSRFYRTFRATIRRNVVSWVGELQPSAMADTYTVKIEYALRKRPKVWVLQPRLYPQIPGEKIKHTFSDGSVCLHLPGEWTPTMYVADLIVPWLALWLFHYEAWRATGKWHGGGHEPNE